MSTVRRRIAAQQQPDQQRHKQQEEEGADGIKQRQQQHAPALSSSSIDDSDAQAVSESGSCVSCDAEVAPPALLGESEVEVGRLFVVRRAGWRLCPALYTDPGPIPAAGSLHMCSQAVDQSPGHGVQAAGTVVREHRDGTRSARTRARDGCAHLLLLQQHLSLHAAAAALAAGMAFQQPMQQPIRAPSASACH